MDLAEICISQEELEQVMSDVSLGMYKVTWTKKYVQSNLDSKASLGR